LYPAISIRCPLFVIKKKDIQLTKEKFPNVKSNSTHWILIILKWLLGFLIPLQQVFIEGGYMLVEEFRMCGMSNEIL
jgi:hypothetical protein